MSDAQSHSMRYQQERLPGSLRYRNANCQHPFVFPRASSLLPPTLTLRYPPCPLLLRMVPCPTSSPPPLLSLYDSPLALCS